jgi:hypothetical protein
MQEPQRFPVRFHSSRVGQPANAFELAGKGLVEIGDGYLTLRGSRHRTLRPPTPAVETIHLVNVVNVWRDGKQIGCMIQTGDGNKPLALSRRFRGGSSDPGHAAHSPDRGVCNRAGRF